MGIERTKHHPSSKQTERKCNDRVVVIQTIIHRNACSNSDLYYLVKYSILSLKFNEYRFILFAQIFIAPFFDLVLNFLQLQNNVKIE